MNISANPISATKPQFTCVNYDQQITAVQNSVFNTKMYIMDSKYQAKIPAVAWTVI